MFREDGDLTKSDVSLPDGSFETQKPFEVYQSRVDIIVVYSQLEAIVGGSMNYGV